MVERYAIAALRRSWASVVCAALALAATASAQAPAASGDAVMSAYREYRAAIERDDMAAAEPAAERAWRAAEAADAPPPRIGALALNLANARLRLERAADAVEPARRALALAETGAGDRLTARLVLGEALLASNFEEGESILTPALAEARTAGAHDEFAWPAAHALALAATRKRNWPLVATAWESAFHHAAGGAYQLELSRAEALIGRGVSLMARRQDGEAYALFVQAGALTAPLAPERDDDLVTVGELFYARAYVFSAAVVARMRSEQQQGRPETSRLAERAGLPGLAPVCPMQANVSPTPVYPREAREGHSVGAVVVRLSVSAAGEVRNRKVLAAVPSDDFARAVDTERVTWSVTRRPDAPVGCRMETSDILIPVIFVFANG